MSGIMKAMGFGGGYATSKSTIDQIREYEFEKAMHAHIQTKDAGAHSHSIDNLTNQTISWKDMKRQLLYMRLDLPGYMQIPFAYLDFMQGEDTVYVVVAKTRKDKPIIIEDDIGLFPSDTLVTQLRLMMG